MKRALLILTLILVALGVSYLIVSNGGVQGYYQNIYKIYDGEDGVLFCTDTDEVIHDTVFNINGSEYLILTIDKGNTQKYFVIYDYIKKALYKSESVVMEQKYRSIEYENISIDDSKISLFSDGELIETRLDPFKQQVKSDIIFEVKYNAKYDGFQEAYYNDSVLFRVELGGNHGIIKETFFSEKKTHIFTLYDAGQEDLIYLIIYDVLSNKLDCSDYIYLPNYEVYTHESIDYSYFDITPDSIAFYLKNGVLVSLSKSSLVYDSQKIINYYENE